MDFVGEGFGKDARACADRLDPRGADVGEGPGDLETYLALRIAESKAEART